MPFDETTLIDADKAVDIANWPPIPFVPGDSLMLAGFPGATRAVRDANTLRSDFVVLLAKAEKPADWQLAIRVNETYWPKGTDSLPPEADLGGMSGGPVFRRRSDAVGDVEIAGFIYEAHTKLELVYARQAWCVMADGRINRARHL